MDEFTASNGGTVKTLTNGRMKVANHTRERLTENAAWFESTAYLDAEMVPTLREFFQAERDEELGRWRWPENRDYVVYDFDEGIVRVVAESTGTQYVFERADATMHIGTFPESGAACDYFDAHPEPKPWEDAKPGEIWELTAESKTRQYAAIASRDISGDATYLIPVDNPNAPTLGVRARVITAGHRVYPEAF